MYRTSEGSMAQLTTRDTLIETAKVLLWRDGYESMSPRKVLQESGAGQGSLYHHFSGKKDLAVEALDSVCRDMIAEIDSLFDADEPPLEQLHRYLCKERKGLKGCKLGRLSNETSFRDKDLRKPLAQYFRHLKRRLVGCLEQSIERGDFQTAIQPDQLADTIVSTVQGGYVLSRSTNDTKAIMRSTRALWSLISAQTKSTAR